MFLSSERKFRSIMRKSWSRVHSKSSWKKSTRFRSVWIRSWHRLVAWNAELLWTQFCCIWPTMIHQLVFEIFCCFPVAYPLCFKLFDGFLSDALGDLLELVENDRILLEMVGNASEPLEIFKCSRVNETVKILSTNSFKLLSCKPMYVYTM